MKQEELDHKTSAFEERMKSRKATEDAIAKQEEADKAEKLRSQYLNRTGRKRVEP
jgi:hypothetical protein